MLPCARDEPRRPLEFRILGPLEAWAGGCQLSLGGAKPRALLAILLLHANAVVSRDRLIEDLWGEDAPATARSALRVHVAQLRNTVGDGRLQTRTPGYSIAVAAGELDLDRFRRLVDQADCALRDGQPSTSADTLHEALSLWRGPALADLSYEAFARAAIADLEEQRLAALERRIEADLALGRHGDLVGELEALVVVEPLRESLLRQLMLALYRCGRQADALAAYRQARRRLVDDLGIEPSPELQRLERAILRHEPTLELFPHAELHERPGRPANLPAAPTTLVGRGRELAGTQALLRRHNVRLVTLTGPGGTGKTRLALKLAAELLDEFSDGVFVVDLAPIRDPALVASAIARALGVNEGGDWPVTQGVKAWLRDKRVLVLLDNLEHLLDAAPLIGELLAAAPRLKVLATSRTPLHISGEHEYPVGPLETPDLEADADVHRLSKTEAIQLFVERASAVQPGFSLTEQNAMAVAAICVRLDGLPLAIELAAVRAKVLTPQAILSRLDRRLELLTSGARDLPPRQQTLRATIDWSYDLLAPHERVLFRRLAVLVGGCSLEAAQAVAGENGRDVLDGIASLVDKSVLQLDPKAGDEPRFRMLETIREYALERLAQSGETDVTRRRHAHFYCALAERAEAGLRSPHQQEWLTRLDAEYNNLRAALAWCAASGEADLGLRMASELWRFLQIRGYLTEGRQQLERLLALTDPSYPNPIHAAAQSCLGMLAFFQGDYQPARALFEQALTAQRQFTDRRAIGFSTYGLALVTQAEGDYRTARALSQESRAAFQDTRDVWGMAMTLQGLAQATYLLGHVGAARFLFEEGLRCSRQLGDRRNIAVFLACLGTIAREQGDHAQARLFLGESLAIHRELGDAWGIPTQLAQLGLLAQHEGNHELARQHFAEALAIRRETADRPGLAASLECFAGLAAQNRRPAAAARLLGAATALRAGLSAPGFYTERTDRQKHTAAARATLGQHAYETAWEQGRSLSLHEIIATDIDTPA